MVDVSLECRKTLLIETCIYVCIYIFLLDNTFNTTGLLKNYFKPNLNDNLVKFKLFSNPLCNAIFILVCRHSVLCSQKCPRPTKTGDGTSHTNS